MQIRKTDSFFYPIHMLVCLQAVGNVYKQLATISSLMKVNPNIQEEYSYKEYHLLLKQCII